jgi:hypothetical protein
MGTFSSSANKNEKSDGVQRESAQQEEQKIPKRWKKFSSKWSALPNLTLHFIRWEVNFHHGKMIKFSWMTATYISKLCIKSHF